VPFRQGGPYAQWREDPAAQARQQHPQSALALEQLFADAGAPAGVYTNLFIAGHEVGSIIDNPLVRGVSLTGNDRAGANVAEIADRNVKKSVLELGGSDPFIVLDDHNLERTVEAAMIGRMHNMVRAALARTDGCGGPPGDGRPLPRCDPVTRLTTTA
jgi:hypothetical protein